jgi:hypothetical protein
MRSSGWGCPFWRGASPQFVPVRRLVVYQCPCRPAGLCGLPGPVRCRTNSSRLPCFPGASCLCASAHPLFSVVRRWLVVHQCALPTGRAVWAAGSGFAVAPTGRGCRLSRGELSMCEGRPRFVVVRLRFVHQCACRPAELYASPDFAGPSTGCGCVPCSGWGRVAHCASASPWFAVVRQRFVRAPVRPPAGLHWVSALIRCRTNRSRRPCGPPGGVGLSGARASPLFVVVWRLVVCQCAVRLVGLCQPRFAAASIGCGCVPCSGWSRCPLCERLAVVRGGAAAVRPCTSAPAGRAALGLSSDSLSHQQVAATVRSSRWGGVVWCEGVAAVRGECGGLSCASAPSGWSGYASPDCCPINRLRLSCSGWVRDCPFVRRLAVCGGGSSRTCAPTGRSALGLGSDSLSHQQVAAACGPPGWVGLSWCEGFAAVRGGVAAACRVPARLLAGASPAAAPTGCGCVPCSGWGRVLSVRAPRRSSWWCGGGSSCTSAPAGKGCTGSQPRFAVHKPNWWLRLAWAPRAAAPIAVHQQAAGYRAEALRRDQPDMPVAG